VLILLECKESDATFILSSVKSLGSLGWIFYNHQSCVYLGITVITWIFIYRCEIFMISNKNNIQKLFHFLFMFKGTVTDKTDII
jgi:hypothetical protein